METGQFVIPTLATIALGAALLVPLRDDRRGRRATLGGHDPLRPEFGSIADATSTAAHSDSFATESTMGKVPSEHANESLVECEVAQHRSEPLGEPSDIDVPHDRSARAFGLDVTTPRPDFGPHDVTESVDETIEAEFGSRRARERHTILRRLQDFAARSLTIGHRVPADVDRTSPATIRLEAPTHGAEGIASLPLPIAESTTIERSFAAELASLLSPDGGKIVRSADPPIAVDDATKREPRQSSSEPSPDAEAASSTVVTRLRIAGDRVVPITRLPLRPQTLDVTWPRDLDPPRIVNSRDDRHALLRTIGRASDDAFAGVLEVAYQQEDAHGRLLALRALARTTPTMRTHATFVEALKSGTDEERATAVDALVFHGDRDDLASACNDRVDAIAAQAALAFVASDRREDYRVRLRPFVDEARIEVILILLSGVVE